ncbi:MAG TPA: glycoside hydrolase family 3 N-terminal domain-containing protein [Thermoanaerobaculia bacterium]|nr:glycoside hydrolase family 3 N-terminal domain-containing protein [Thermoanaerobaculia bacterium]
MRGGDLLMVGLPGKELTGETKKALTAIQPAAVLVAPANVEDVEQLVDLLAEVRGLLPEALLATDAEGGRLDTLRDVVGPSLKPSELAAGAPSLALETGRWLGHALRLFDIDLDLAPVVDVDRGEENNALDGRYLGSDAQAVTARARAFVRGLHTAGIGACLKHFPGLGGATDDTHYMGSSVFLPKDAIELDMMPFRELGEVAGAVMVGHANYPAFDRDGLPATLSSQILQDLLRTEVGFTGLAISDDLGMKALEDQGELGARAEAALLAGCDLLVLTRSLEEVAAVADRLENERFDARREEAAERMARFRDHLRSLKVRHEQELADSGVPRGYDLEMVQEKLESLRNSAAARGEDPAATQEE